MKVHFFITSLCFTILTTGCSGNETTTTETQETDTTVAIVKESTPDDSFDIGESSGYASDWSMFRSAVQDNSLNDFNSFMGSDVSDPEGLLSMLREEWVLSALVETPYEDLTISDYNGTEVKEFSATVEGSDDEGNTYESGVYLYFEEAPDGLKLVNVLMAG